MKKLFGAGPPSCALVANETTRPYLQKGITETLGGVLLEAKLQRKIGERF